jgi:hypothetical protein
MAANVVAILTCDVPNVCLSVHLGPTGSTACEIQDVIWFHAQCQCSYSLPLTRNKWFDIYPCAEHPLFMQCSLDLWQCEVVSFLMCQLKAHIASPLLPLIHMQHHRLHRAKYEFQQVDILPLPEYNHCPLNRALILRFVSLCIIVQFK